MWTYRTISDGEAVRTEAPIRLYLAMRKVFLRAISIGLEVHGYLVIDKAGYN